MSGPKLTTIDQDAPSRNLLACALQPCSLAQLAQRGQSGPRERRGQLAPLRAAQAGNLKRRRMPSHSDTLDKHRALQVQPWPQQKHCKVIKWV